MSSSYYPKKFNNASTPIVSTRFQSTQDTWKTPEVEVMNK